MVELSLSLASLRFIHIWLANFIHSGKIELAERDCRCYSFLIIVFNFILRNYFWSAQSNNYVPDAILGKRRMLLCLNENVEIPPGLSEKKIWPLNRDMIKTGQARCDVDVCAQLWYFCHYYNKTCIIAGLVVCHVVFVLGRNLMAQCDNKPSWKKENNKTRKSVDETVPTQRAAKARNYLFFDPLSIICSS